MLDELDRKILDILKQDARTPNTRIAEMLGKSDTVISFRIRRLKQYGVIKGFTVVLDPLLELEESSDFIEKMSALFDAQNRRIEDLQLGLKACLRQIEKIRTLRYANIGGEMHE